MKTMKLETKQFPGGFRTNLIVEGVREPGVTTSDGPWEVVGSPGWLIYLLQPKAKFYSTAEESEQIAIALMKKKVSRLEKEEGFLSRGKSNCLTTMREFLAR